MPIEQPGRIRGTSIEEGSIRARSFATTIQSDNFVAGVSGWRISRVTGDVEFNEGAFRGDVTISGDLEVSGTDGILVTNGGDIEIAAGGDLIITGGKLTAGPTTVNSLGVTVGPTTLNSSGVEVGPTTLSSTGLQVGSDVVIDSAGLKIDGVLQPAIETIRASGSFQNVSLGTSFTNLVSLNLSIPSFATVVDVMAIGRLQVANTSGGTQSFEARCSVAGGSTDTARDYADNNLSSNVTATRADRVTGSPSTVNVLLEGRVTSGSNSSNVGRLNVMAVARRVA